jgi:hypothetical protein
MMNVRNSSTATAVLVAMVLTVLAATAGPASAQDAGFPPWPIIYDGTVEVDGEPLANGSLTARVGDWTSVAVPVIDGRFACVDPCLIAGPPTFAYVGATITFHLEGMEKPATLVFEFPNLAQPDRRTEALEFSTGGGIPGWLFAVAAALAVVVGGVVVALMVKGGKDQSPEA